MGNSISMEMISYLKFHVPIWLMEKINRSSITVGVVTILSVFFTVWIAKILALRSKRKQKQEEIKKAKEILAMRLETHENQGLLENMCTITDLTLEELIAKLQTGELKATDVLLAFQAKASSEDKKYNFITEILWEAETEAIALDMKASKGVLHGVPVSLKDCYNIKGYDSTCGMSALVNCPAIDDSVIGKVLKKQGAIPFIKTNVPQTMFSVDCDNPINGQTLNPNDCTRSPGGSSGGEGVAVVTHSSPLGFGSDIGGSIRIPASMNGCCGLKPTSYRLSTRGLSGPGGSNDTLRASHGPLAHNVEALAIAMRALLVPDMFELDSDVPPLIFKEEIYQSKEPLKIGYYVEADFFASAPASQRAVLLAKQKLEDMGHKLVLYMPPGAKEAIEDYGRVLLADQGIELSSYLKYDSITHSMQPLYYVLSMPVLFRKMFAWLCRPFSYPFYAHLKACSGCASVSEWWQLSKEKKNWRRNVINHWKEKKLDAVLCPSVGPALPIGYPAKCLASITYVSLYNLLDFPAGTLPVTRVTAEDEARMKKFPTPDISHKIVKKGLSKGTVGLPVSVQVVTLPWQEEQCLRVMKDIETGL